MVIPHEDLYYMHAVYRSYLAYSFHWPALATKTADGVNPFSFNVFFISPAVYVFLGKVDANLTVGTSYEISSEHTHSATSTSATSSANPLMCSDGKLTRGRRESFRNGAL